MDVLLDPHQILREDIHLGGRDIPLGALRLAIRDNLIVVLLLVNTRDITAIEDVVDILQHLLVDDLSIAE